MVKDNSDKLYGSGGLKIAEPVDEDTPEVKVEPPRIKPNADMVLIRRLEKNEMTAGGIVLPGSIQNDFFRAKVLAMGRGGMMESGQWISPADCEVGDIVLVRDERKPGPEDRGRISKHLIPVTPNDKQFLLTPGAMIYATELRDDTTSPA